MTPLPDGDRTVVVDYIDQSSRRKQVEMWNRITNSTDPKALWAGINWNGTSMGATEAPDIDDIKTHFQSKSSTDDESTLLCEVTGNVHVPVLDDEIKVEEVCEGFNRLKPGKATADGWAKQMIPKGDIFFMTFLTFVMNIIFKNHLYPTQWRTTIVNAIYKCKGLRSLAANFRPVSLVQLLSKLFDFTMLKRFMKWFTPHDAQTAYTSGKSAADHVFFMRCMISYAVKVKKKLFLIAIDFDGAFDRVSRSILIKKLVKFGAGTVFTLCIASIYMSTENTIFQGKDSRTYDLYAGIKQGLPLSPMLFLFYINDIFPFFEALYKEGRNILDKISMLIHADDATLIATLRSKAVEKLKSLLFYCNLNKILLQYSKCVFIVINGDENDREKLPFGDTFIENGDHIGLLGSHLDQDASMKKDLARHCLKRYPSCIKYYNFLRSNHLAPLVINIKVLEACVVSSLLHNCETFGNCPTTELERMYMKLIKAALNVRPSTPNDLVLIESGLKPLKAVILVRQFNFFKRFQESLSEDGARREMMDTMLTNPTAYLRHYVNLESEYIDAKEIYKKYDDELKSRVRTRAEKGGYKFQMYLKLNPQLEKSPYLQQDINNPIVKDITKFRLGSHRFPIETGRWRNPQKARVDRTCAVCGVTGDELHCVYVCPLVNRDGLVLPGDFKWDWNDPNILKLFQEMRVTDLL